jgi:DNA mismatch repair protein MutL
VGGTAISPGADDLPHFSREPAKPSWATARTPLAFDFTPGAALVSDRTSSVSEDSRFSPALNPTFVGNQEFKHSDQLDTLHAPASPDSRPGAHPVFSKFRPENFLGDLFRTFLAYDLGDELGLIDQHAAHERIRFELLKKRAIQRAQNQDVQDLLIPEAVRFDPEAVEKLQSRLSLLSRLGFEAEIFGPGQLLVRSIPPEWGNLDLRTRLKNLVERLLALDGANAQSEELFLDERLFEKLASEACRSSVRAGDRIDAEAAAALIDQLSHCEHPWNCPHGRPTLARVPRSRFEEWFQRIV